MLIPAQTHRAHLLQSDLRCDTLHVLFMAHRGSGFADMNACSLLDADANQHWPENPVRNHYDWMWTGRYDAHGHEIRRPMTHAERHRPLIEWTEARYLRWRQGPEGGHKPATVATRQAQAKRLGVIICWELKSRAYQSPARARRFVAAVKASGHTAYFMTLVTMRGWGRKLKAFKLAGADGTALLAHGVKKTLRIRAALRIYRPYIDRIWGHFAPSN